MAARPRRTPLERRLLRFIRDALPVMEQAAAGRDGNTRAKLLRKVQRARSLLRELGLLPFAE